MRNSPGMKTTLCAVMLSLLCMARLLAEPPDPRRVGPENLVVAGIVDGRVFSLAIDADRAQWHWIDPARRPDVANPIGPKTSIPKCWRVDVDGIYALDPWVGRERHSYVNRSYWDKSQDRNVTLAELQAKPSFRNRGKPDEAYNSSSTDNYSPCCIAEFLGNAANDIHDPQGRPVGFAYDPLPHGRGAVRVFVKRVDIVTIHEGLYWYDPAQNRVRGEWRTVGRIPVPFQQRFRIFPDGDAYIFVTEDRGICRAVQNNGEWKCKVVRPASSLSLVAVLTDDTNRRAFAFGRDFWFALDDKLSVDKLPEIRCRDVTLGHPELGQPLRTVANCADVLHEAGVLLPPPAEAEIPARR